MKTKIRTRQLNISQRDSVRVHTQGNIATISGGAPDTIDGVSLAVDDRILVASQTSPIDNGIYVVTTVGTGSDGTWVRAVDMDAEEEARFGDFVVVMEGTVDGLRIFTQDTAGSITVGTDANTWTRLSDTDTGVTLANFVFNEVPTGAIDGSNKTFDTANLFEAGTLQVFLNGQLLEEGAGNDYTETDSDTFEMLDAPKGAPGNPDKVTVHYIKQ